MLYKAILLASGLALLLALPVRAQRTDAVITEAQLTDLMQRVGANSEHYMKTFRDLTAEERRHFELFTADGKVTAQNRNFSALLKPERANL